MDDRTKKKLAIEAAPALVPICRAAVSGLYTQKRLESKHQHEKELAEIRAQKVENPDRPARATQTAAQTEQADTPAGDPAPDEEPAAPADPLGEAVTLAEELDQQLERSLELEECGFCRDVIDQLRTQPLEVQRQGLREMQELQNVMYSEGTGREDIDAVMSDMEIVPRMVMETEEGP